MKNKTNFVVTTDKETADKLIAEGFRLISEVSGKFTFEAKSGSMNFNNIDVKKVAYTNMLTF